ncbi:hypothetical protein [Natronoglomus mannanivorans]|uniref:Uncharacterized protein n=1 Tax=Natronoglomus mannanivorans TaxID=2979990 RepID=A0AAP2YX15_9EURY|nr:hypothetical protein [Halobacteria archaeon AArc-xg1-1]
MVPELTRRRLLGGVAVTGVGGGVAMAPRTWYPNPVVDRMIGYRRLPDTDTQPAPPESTIREGLESLERHLEEAETLWKGVDTDRDDLPDAARMGPTLLGDATDRYQELRESNPDRRALANLRVAHGYAGYAIGAGRVVRGETDAQGLVDRGEEIRSEIAALRETIEYRGENPATDVATLYWIERPLHFARLNSHRSGMYMGGVAPAEAYQDYDIPRTWEAHLQADVHVLESRHAYREYESGGGEDGDTFDSGLETLFERFDEEVEATRQSDEERKELREALAEGAYGHARYQCWQFTHGSLETVSDGGPTGGLDLLQTVRHARNVLKLRAYPDAVERFVFDEGERIDPALVYREEKRAATRARELVEAHDTPLFRLLVDDAIRLLRVGDHGLPDDDRARARADAYAYYLVGHTQLRHASDVYETMLAALE